MSSTQTIEGKIVTMASPMTKYQAEQHDKAIRNLCAKIQRTENETSKDREAIGHMVKEMYDGEGWRELGWDSGERWYADACSTIGLAPFLIASGMPRYELVGRLHDSGMDQATVISTTGVSPKTVERDVTKWLAKQSNDGHSEDELTNKSESPEPEQVTPRPEARIVEGDICVKDGFNDTFKRVKMALDALEVNPTYKQVQQTIRELNKRAKVFTELAEKIQAMEQERSLLSR